MSDQFDSITLRNTLTQHSEYAASQATASHLEWRPGEKGHIVYDKCTQNIFIGVAVVKALDFKLNCGTLGNHLTDKFGDVTKAKYQIFTRKPMVAGFHDDFDILFNVLKKLQSDVATTDKRKDLLFEDKNEKMIRFAADVF
ncbi:hypothetical protein J3R82DRAFT_11851 [Butyriboletus roseoflavus]|nr:hypothetical protein J3R82DRAFT_11851 [Butyriboletus roseoflavus]